MPLGVHVKLFLMAMFFAGVTNGLLLLVLYRMRSLGHHVGLWRTLTDYGLYREYLKIAPTKRWSRAPIVIAIISFMAAGLLLSFAIFLL